MLLVRQGNQQIARTRDLVRYPHTGAENTTYAGVALMRHGRLLETFKGKLSRRLCVNGADHANVAVRLRDELLAEEPYGLRGVGDSQIPCREPR